MNSARIHFFDCPIGRGKLIFCICMIPNRAMRRLQVGYPGEGEAKLLERLAKLTNGSCRVTVADIHWSLQNNFIDTVAEYRDRCRDSDPMAHHHFECPRRVLGSKYMCVCADSWPVSVTNSLEGSSEAVQAPQIDFAVGVSVEPSRFDQLLWELKNLHDAKATDYAGSMHHRPEDNNLVVSEQIGVPRWVGTYTRLMDKQQRGRKLIKRLYLNQGGPAVKDEALVDTLRDEAVYSLLEIEMLEELGVDCSQFKKRLLQEALWALVEIEELEAAGLV